MGGTSSKLDNINREVQSIRSSTRRSRTISKENKDALAEKLAKQGHEANSLRHKVKDKKIDKTMRLISDTMNEILAKDQQEEILDKAAVESNSFVNVTVKKNGTAAEGAAEKELIDDHKKFKGVKSLAVNRRSMTAKTSLLDIEEKIKSLKPQISTAIQNRDKQGLRFHKETVKVLATDLELIPSTSALVEDKKNKLQSQLSSSYQKIDKAIRDISRNHNLEYLKKDEQKNKIRFTLDGMERELQQIENSLGVNDLNSINALKNSISTVLVKLKGVEENEEEFRDRKAELTQRTNQLSNKLDENFQNVVKGIVISASEKAKSVDLIDPNCPQQLKDIKNYVNKLDVSNKDTQKLRSSLLVFIDSTLEDLDKQKPELVKITERQLPETKSNQTKPDVVENKQLIEEPVRKRSQKIENLLMIWNDLKRSASFSEEVLVTLENVQKDIQKCINQKRKSIGAFIEESYVPSSNKTMAQSTPNLYSDEFLKNKQVIEEVDQPQKYTFKLTEINPRLHLKSPLVQSTKEELEISSDIRNIKDSFRKLKSQLSSFQHNKEIYDEVQDYVERLNKYVDHPKEHISTAAKDVIEDIHSTYTDSLKISIPARASINRNSIEMSLTQITEISSFVEGLQTEVENVTNDLTKLDELTNSLNKCREQLEGVKVSPKYTMIFKTKEETLKLIDEYLSILDNKKQSENVKKEFETDIFPKLNQQYQNLFDKVNKYNGNYKDIAYSKLNYNLNKLKNDVQDKIFDNYQKKDLIQKIDELLKILQQRATKTQVYNFTEEKERAVLVNLPEIKREDFVSKLRNEIENLKERLNMFSGSYKDIQFNKIEFGLSKLVTDIQEKITDSSTRNQMVEEVGQLWDILDGKCKTSNRRLTYQEPSQNFNNKDQFDKRNTIASGESLQKIDAQQKVESEIKTLQSRVNRFQGNYGDLLYNQIEHGLNRLLVEIPERIIDESVSKELYEDVQKLIRILEQKASKPQSFRKSSEVKFKSDIGSNNAASNDLFNALNNFTANPVEKSKEELLITESIVRMENNVADIESEIQTFIGSTNSKEYEEIDTFLINVQLEIEKIQIDPKYKDLYKRKLKLLSKLNNCGNILDDRAEECDQLEKIEKKTKELCSIIDYNLNSLNGSEVEQVDEDLIALQLEIGRLAINEELMGRRNFCERKINDYIKLIRQFKDASISSANHETFV